MRNIMLKLAYDGTGYAGWQRQKDQATIQETLEERLSQITNGAVALHGAGRTDAGVHALGMTASFETESEIPTDGLLKGLNSMLPEDIRVLAVEDRDPQFHARISAVGKLYVYQLLVGGICLPTERLYSYHIRHDLDIEPMRDCLAYLVGEHDFGCFEASGSRDPEYTGGRGAVRRISRAELIAGNGLPLPIRIEIAGDGFLRHMVRNIVGTIIEVGSGRMDFADLCSIIEGKDRDAAGPTAPARGLFLKEVFY
jgi:tRNA pseudouridine38-40 synthase